MWRDEVERPVDDDPPVVGAVALEPDHLAGHDRRPRAPPASSSSSWSSRSPSKSGTVRRSESSSIAGSRRRLVRWWRGSGGRSRPTSTPSPTAEATRFIESERTSPAAKTPGRLVSSANGGRASAHPSARCASGDEVVPGHDEAVVVAHDVGAEPVGARRGADVDEEPRGVDLRRGAGVPVGERQPLEVAVTGRRRRPRCGRGRGCARRRGSARRGTATCSPRATSPRTTSVTRLA